MGSSFEDLVARSLTVKTDCNFDSRFRSYDFFKAKKRNSCDIYTCMWTTEIGRAHV